MLVLSIVLSFSNLITGSVVSTMIPVSVVSFPALSTATTVCVPSVVIVYFPSVNSTGFPSTVTVCKYFSFTVKVTLVSLIFTSFKNSISGNVLSIIMVPDLVIVTLSSFDGTYCLALSTDFK